MKLSARNVLTGRVVAVARGATTAHVKIDIGVAGRRRRGRPGGRVGYPRRPEGSGGTGSGRAGSGAGRRLTPRVGAGTFGLGRN
jgi:hypothetical protein